MADPLPLIGPVGVEFLTDALTTRNPKEAIEVMQSKGALQHPGCNPVLQLLDQLGVSRLRAHQHVVHEATKLVVDRIRSIQDSKEGRDGAKDNVVEQLLQASFPYLGIPALRMVPIAAMQAMKEVPHQFLRQLGHDKEVFDLLPQRVKQQVWEHDKKLLAKYVGEQIDAFKYEVAMLLKTLKMDDSLGPPPGARAAGPKLAPMASRKLVRGSSKSVQALRYIVDGSRKLYGQTVELVVAKLRDSDSVYCGLKQDSFCSIRSQLLMALHDRGGDMAGRDPLHQLAWTLDACVAMKGLEPRHLVTVRKFFRPFEAASKHGAGGGSARKKGGKHGSCKGGRRQLQSSDDEDASSAGGEHAVGGLDSMRALGEAGMVLRDPPVSHMLAHHVARRIQAAAEAGTMPKDDEELVSVTQLLQLAAECRQMLRQAAYHLPDPPEDVLRGLFPYLASYCVDATARLEGMQVATAEPHKEHVVEVLAFSEAGRKVTEALALQRLVAGDLPTTLVLLKALAQVVAKSSKAANEMGPFAHTLASRLGAMVAAGQLETEDPVWVTAVEGLLLKCVDTDTWVHDEILRMLLACAPKLPLTQLAAYLAATLEASRKARQRYIKRHKAPAKPEVYHKPEQFPLGNFNSENLDGNDAGGGGDKPEALQEEQPKDADGVKATYAMFARQVPGLTAEVAPALLHYLAPPMAPDAPAEATPKPGHPATPESR